MGYGGGGVPTPWFLQVMLADMQFGRGTDGRFLFRLGDSLDSACLPETEPDVQRALTHYLDGYCLLL